MFRPTRLFRCLGVRPVPPRARIRRRRKGSGGILLPRAGGATGGVPQRQQVGDVRGEVHGIDAFEAAHDGGVAADEDCGLAPRQGVSPSVLSEYGWLAAACCEDGTFPKCGLTFCAEIPCYVASAALPSFQMAINGRGFTPIHIDFAHDRECCAESFCH